MKKIEHGCIHTMFYIKPLKLAKIARLNNVSVTVSQMVNLDLGVSRFKSTEVDSSSRSPSPQVVAISPGSSDEFRTAL